MGRPAEWQEGLGTTDRSGIPVVNDLDQAQAPLVLPIHFTVDGDELLLHLARPDPVWPHLHAAGEVRLAVTGDHADVPTYWRAEAGGPLASSSRDDQSGAMTKRLRCLVGLHQWRRQHNDAGQMYRECSACGKQDDPSSRIGAGPGAGASA